ncbi:hypothetical protein DL95DRAFT_468156 [Leptodontidium sp. 2 PMI_412]|nr:hypothetical protein DL95DRAFT_468156 [Leptodontidium sp. 2 PMI_412]
MHSSTLAFLFLVLTSSSLADFEVNLAQSSHENNEIAERTYFDFESLGSLFSKRDDCGTQYGPTWVDCGPYGCYQPSLGQVCCPGDIATLGIIAKVCTAAQMYATHLHFLKSWSQIDIPPSCCGTGFGCPANATDTSASTSASTSPASTTTSVAAVSTSSKAVATTLTPTPTPTASTSPSAAVKGTTNVVGGTTQTSILAKTSSSGTTSTVVSVSGAKKLVEVDGIALAFLGVVGFAIGFM